MPNEIHTQTIRGKRTAYSRRHVGESALDNYIAQMDDYTIEERNAARQILAYMTDVCYDFVIKGGIVSRQRVLRRGVSALNFPEKINALFVTDPIIEVRYDDFRFPVATSTNVHMYGMDKVHILKPFPEGLTILSDGFTKVRPLKDGKDLNHWSNLCDAMNRVVDRLYKTNQVPTIMAKATIVDNAFADAILARL